MTSDIIDQNNLDSLQSSSSKQPDHSVVNLEFQYPNRYLQNDASLIISYVNDCSYGQPDNNVIIDRLLPKKKYIFLQYY